MVNVNIRAEVSNKTVADIAGALVDALSDSELITTGGTGSYPRSYRIDFSRFRAPVPRFAARWTIPAGAEELAQAYVGHGLTQQAFTRRFTRLSARQAAGSLATGLCVPCSRVQSGVLNSPSASRSRYQVTVRDMPWTRST